MLTKSDQVGKKKQRKVKTPLPSTPYKCARCGIQYNLSIHHVFYGDKPTRDNSSEYGCVEWLCHNHHQGQNGIHSGNKELDLELKRKHQERLEKEMTREEFIKLFGRNYL
jgi:hypothetical protein